MSVVERWATILVASSLVPMVLIVILTMGAIPDPRYWIGGEMNCPPLPILWTVTLTGWVYIVTVLWAMVNNEGDTHGTDTERPE